MKRKHTNDEPKIFYDQYGQPVDEKGRPVDAYGRAYADYDKDGNPPPMPKKKIAKQQIARKTKEYDNYSTGPLPSAKKKRRRRHKRHPFLITLAILLVACIVVGVLGVNALFLSSYTYDDTDESSLMRNTEHGIMTIALFGVDTREDGSVAGTRSDAIMLLVVDPSRDKIKTISLMRDSLVDVPGHGETKLTHAYAYGGAQLALQTINENFGLHVTEYMTVNFEQMAAIVDSVGGIDVTIADDEVDELNKYIGSDAEQYSSGGLQHMNGVQAVAYGRIRYNTGGDWGRTERQSVMLNALFSQATSSPKNMLKFVHGVMPNITSSMSKGDFWYMGLYTLMHGIPKMEHVRLPLDGEWAYDTTDSGMSVVTFNNETVAQHLQDYIYDDVDLTAESDE